MKRENGIESQLLKAQDDAETHGDHGSHGADDHEQDSGGFGNSGNSGNSGQAVMASVVASVLTFKSEQGFDVPLKPQSNENNSGQGDGLNLDSPSAIGRAIRQMLYEMDEEAIFLDPPEVFDDAILGTTENAAGPVCVIYDSEKCIDLLMSHNDWDREEAMEYFSFNVSGAHGEGFPIFLCRPIDMNIEGVEGVESIASIASDAGGTNEAVTNSHALNGSEPRPSYTTKVELDPETGDYIIKLPDELLKEHDWRAGDQINIEPMEHGGCMIFNLSLAERKAGISPQTAA